MTNTLEKLEHPAVAVSSLASLPAVQAFRCRNGEAHLLFACHAALPLGLTPELLYSLWANFQTDCQSKSLDIPWVATADLLLSNLCEEVGAGLYEMLPDVRAALVDLLERDSRFEMKRIREIAAFLATYVQPQLNSENLDIRDFSQAQNWLSTAYLCPAKAAEELFATLANAFQQKSDDLLRVTSIVSALEKPLADYPDLLIYARGMANYAQGDIEAAQKVFDQLRASAQSYDFSSEGIPLPASTWQKAEVEQKQSSRQLSVAVQVMVSLAVGSVASGGIWGLRSHMPTDLVLVEPMHASLPTEVHAPETANDELRAKNPLVSQLPLLNPASKRFPTEPLEHNTHIVSEPDSYVDEDYENPDQASAAAEWGAEPLVPTVEPPLEPVGSDSDIVTASEDNIAGIGDEDTVTTNVPENSDRLDNLPENCLTLPCEVTRDASSARGLQGNAPNPILTDGNDSENIIDIQPSIAPADNSLRPVQLDESQFGDVQVIGEVDLTRLLESGEARLETEGAASGEIDGPAVTATSPDGSLTAISNEDNVAVIQDADGNLVAGPLAGAGGAITALAFSEDGQTLATGTNTGKVRYWGVDGEAKGDVFKPNPDGTAITGLAFEGNDKLSVSSQERRGLWGLNGLPFGETAAAGGAVAGAAGAGDEGVDLGRLEDGTQVAQGNVGPVVITPSGEAELALAKHLTDSGAKMYGAYWCPHCHDQKSLFGKEAYTQIPYIECAEDGRNSQTAICRAVPEVIGFPTWEVNGQFLDGSQSLETLAAASGYEGPTDFVNSAGAGGSSSGG